MLKGKVLFYFQIILVVLSTAGYDIYAAENEYKADVLEKTAGKELVDKVKKIFSEAAVVTVAYIPIGNTGGPYGASRVDNGWKYKLSFRCVISCEDYGLGFQKYLMSGLRLSKGCPYPFTASLEFQGSEKVLTKIYFHESGTCFQFGEDGDSFYTKESFWDVKDEFLRSQISK